MPRLRLLPQHGSWAAKPWCTKGVHYTKPNITPRPIAVTTRISTRITIVKNTVEKVVLDEVGMGSGSCGCLIPVDFLSTNNQTESQKRQAGAGAGKGLPGACQRTYRAVVLRKRIVVEKGQRRLFEEDQYLLYLTNLPREEASASQVVRLANGRCGQENLIEQLKNGVQAMRMPSDSLESNWGYLVITAQAWDQGLVGTGATGSAFRRAACEDGVSQILAPYCAVAMPDSEAKPQAGLPAVGGQ